MADAPNGYYRGTIKAIIRDKNDYVLMVKEASDFWDLPGGGIDHGETPKDAMARELSEEIDYRGTFDMQLAGAEIVERKQQTGYVLFLMYEVVLHEPYTPAKGKDVVDIQFLDPANYADTIDRSLQLLYKYGTRDSSAVVDYRVKSA